MGEIEALDAEDGGQGEVNAYHMEGEQMGLLRSSMLDSTRPLYECHASCKCTASCPNRVVERGRTVPLQIFRTKDRGWGKNACGSYSCPQIDYIQVSDVLRPSERGNLLIVTWARLLPRKILTRGGRHLPLRSGKTSIYLRWTNSRTPIQTTLDCGHHLLRLTGSSCLARHDL
jgi:hypothetical protein